MKRLLKSLVLIAFIASSHIPAWSQSSTQGKEFWVALIPSRSPDGENPSNHGFDSYIAISAPKKCTAKVSNPQTGWSKIYQIQNDNAWLEIKDIPLNEWYSNTMPVSEQALAKGLKVETTEEVSVYTCLRWNYSMDATNILPTAALQSEYIVQTYGPSNKDGIKRNVFSILAVEDCIVDVTLTAQTEGGKTGSIPNLSLKAGQVYHVRSAEGASLNGSRVVAKDGKKIAVFAGCPLGNIPNNVSDRDLVYEQLFPIDYWGQNFVVVRSKEKDANRVIITAQENNTTVTIYGNYDPSAAKTGDHVVQQNYSFTLNSGESYEFEMSAGYENSRWDSKREVFSGITILDSTAYIKASCPCAVLSYDVGNGYYRKDAGIETYHTKKPGDSKESYWGAPAMTWIAPIEQMMNDVVFGVMGTDKTDRHFVNIVVPKEGVSTAIMQGKPLASYFRPVESNPDYYYARITLPHTVSGTPNPFYHLECKYGFIATVYGNGDDESYAYTVGSSTIKRGVEVDGMKFIAGDWGDEPFCVGNELTFNPQIGTDIIDKVAWDFGDGITATTTADMGIGTKHTYTAPNWYTVEARISAHKDCPATTYPEETVSFTFYVKRPDTIPVAPKDSCLTLEQQKEIIATEGQAHLDSLVTFGERTILNPEAPCYEDKKLALVVYNLETEETKDTIVGQDAAQGYDGKWYYASQDVTDTTYNTSGCNHYVHYYVKVLTCLELSLKEVGERHICPKNELPVEYVLTKGEIKDIDADGYNAIFKVSGYADEKFSIPNRPDEGVITLPTEKITKPGKYTGTIVVEDEYCEQTLSLPVAFSVYYPDSIIKYKFNNVMAVYKPGKGGNAGYEFSNYEWHLVRGINDSILVAGPEYSVLYLGQGITFEEGDEVYVKLTEKTGAIPVLPSCRVLIEDVPNYDTTPDKNQAPATKRLVNRQIVINKGDKTYNIYGQLVQ